MYDLSPEEFEHFVAAVWDARGFDTEVTQLSNDAGKDAIARKDGRRIGIQAKRYQQSNRVTGPEIQQYGSMLHDEAIDHVVIVTSSTFTNAAYRRAQEIDLDLVDGERLLTLADKYRDDLDPKSVEETPESTSSSDENGASGINLLTLPFKLIGIYLVVMLKFLKGYLKLVLWFFLLPIKLLKSVASD